MTDRNFIIEKRGKIGTNSVNRDATLGTVVDIAAATLCVNLFSVYYGD